MPHVQGHFPPTGLAGSEQALRAALEGSLSGLQQGTNLGRSDLESFASQGRGAIDLQGALAGAQGQPAQATAFANFNASPGQQFLRDRGEQALLRNQAAIGGLGGGNVRSALQEQGIGFARQDLNDAFARLGSVSGLGLQAAGQQAGLAGGAGQTAANLAFQTGQGLSSGRTRAGEQIAGQVSGTTSALSNLAAQQGAGISDILNTSAGNLAGLLSGAGIAQGQSQEQLAALLSSIIGQQGNQIAGLPGLPSGQGSSSLGGLGELAGGIGGLLAGIG